MRKGDVRKCNAYRGVKLLEHAMKIVGKVLERRIREVMNADGLQFGFMPEGGTTCLLLYEEYRNCRVLIEFSFYLNL